MPKLLGAAIGESDAMAGALLLRDNESSACGGAAFFNYKKNKIHFSPVELIN